MRAFGIWQVLCLLGMLRSYLCVNDYDGNYVDNYDNEISQDKQDGEPPSTPCNAELSRWDKLFITLEDSHMRQSMLLESAERCCGGMTSLRSQVDRLAQGTCQQCVPSLASACGAQSERASLRLQQGLAELREEEEERERRLNATVRLLLLSGREESARLNRLEEAVALGRADGGMGRQPTLSPGGPGTAFTLGTEPFTSGPKEQEVLSPLATMERSLVAIATELQRIHLQLSKVIEEAGTLRKGRGDT
ncbi:pentraxin-related protein PTX3-like [Mugil cephalus]|uniref:pentraxin-related protein PTX3-like n=1 Tax=Mugil cephalus TaxID=48193 RepID=UPI001FB5ACDB|nr:pentraxin-related protein PTX3-like [Mugil cephalus]